MGRLGKFMFLCVGMEDALVCNSRYVVYLCRLDVKTKWFLMKEFYLSL